MLNERTLRPFKQLVLFAAPAVSFDVPDPARRTPLFLSSPLTERAWNRLLSRKTYP